ncbi:uncharacterized protein LOC122400892 [Colletes gigas]|uniref:uncharacterized protein LOC122400892 n=1 Tax=Colletes gigas TaxID=935657 RepID=UPI001C9B303F|nr:uncharacterized protein LOC122400892 [Colletes gigas]
MALELRSNRSKSTSDILDGIVYENKNVMENSTVNNRYRTYTVKNLKKEKKYFVKTSCSDCNREEESSTPKSQNFVKKWIASLERKNEACKADDEFVTKYYRRNSNPSSDYSCKKKLYDSIRTETNNGCGHHRVNTSENTLVNSNDDMISENKTTVFTNNKIDDQFLPMNDGKRKEGANRSKHRDETCANLRRNGSFRDSRMREANSKRAFDINKNNEKKTFYNSSSFDPNRTRVESEYEDDPCNFYFLKKSNNDRNGNTLEKIFKNSKEKRDTTFDGRSKKKLNRQRSFKDFFGSMIRWKKSENEEKPRRFMSCDHLIEETKTFNSRSVKKLSRALSLKVVALQDKDEDNWTRIRGREAIIHPIYAGIKNEQLLESLARNKEKLFGLNESEESLVKPSAIKDIVKRFSQLPGKTQTNDNFNERGRRLVVENGY